MAKLTKEELKEAIEDELEAIQIWKGGLWNWFS